LALAGCASKAPVTPPPVALPASTAQPTAFPVAGAMPAARVDATVEALRVDLAQRLAEHGVAVTRGGDDSLRLRFDAESSFEADSAQMRAATLLPAADCAVALRGAGAFVVQVLGRAPNAVAVALAERRASSIAAFLIAQGVPAARVRVSGQRAAGVAQIELVYEPIVEGREVRAWMAPIEPAGR
jgi:outer membrane protein OmpA-like peptidoglycan-associated protein